MLDGVVFRDSRRAPNEGVSPATRPSAGAPELAPDERIVCGACGTSITHARERISVDSAHEHTFQNPLGIVYHIGCFRNAPGAAAFGSPTLEHTWFAGFAWQVAICRGCELHLGWRFSSSDSIFFGLILSRLRQVAGSPNIRSDS